MKRAVIYLFVLAVLFLFSSNTQAQSYFTYNGEDFSVLLPRNTDNTQVIKIEF